MSGRKRFYGFRHHGTEKNDNQPWTHSHSGNYNEWGQSHTENINEYCGNNVQNEHNVQWQDQNYGNAWEQTPAFGYGNDWSPISRAAHFQQAFDADCRDLGNIPFCRNQSLDWNSNSRIPGHKQQHYDERNTAFQIHARQIINARQMEQECGGQQFIYENHRKKQKRYRYDTRGEDPDYVFVEDLVGESSTVITYTYPKSPNIRERSNDNTRRYKTRYNYRNDDKRKSRFKSHSPDTSRPLHFNKNHHVSEKRSRSGSRTRCSSSTGRLGSSSPTARRKPDQKSHPSSNKYEVEKGQQNQPKCCSTSACRSHRHSMCRSTSRPDSHPTKKSAKKPRSMSKSLSPIKHKSQSHSSPKPQPSKKEQSKKTVSICHSSRMDSKDLIESNSQSQQESSSKELQKTTEYDDIPAVETVSSSSNITANTSPQLINSSENSQEKLNGEPAENRKSVCSTDSDCLSIKLRDDKTVNFESSLPNDNQIACANQPTEVNDHQNVSDLRPAYTYRLWVNQTYPTCHKSVPQYGSREHSSVQKSTREQGEISSCAITSDAESRKLDLGSLEDVSSDSNTSLSHSVTKQSDKSDALSKSTGDAVFDIVKCSPVSSTSEESCSEVSNNYKKVQSPDVQQKVKHSVGKSDCNSNNIKDGDQSNRKNIVSGRHGKQHISSSKSSIQIKDSIPHNQNDKSTRLTVTKHKTSTEYREVSHIAQPAKGTTVKFKEKTKFSSADSAVKKQESLTAAGTAEKKSTKIVVLEKPQLVKKNESSEHRATTKSEKEKPLKTRCKTKDIHFIPDTQQEKKHNNKQSTWKMEQVAKMHQNPSALENKSLNGKNKRTDVDDCKTVLDKEDQSPEHRISTGSNEQEKYKSNVYGSISAGKEPTGNDLEEIECTHKSTETLESIVVSPSQIAKPLVSDSNGLKQWSGNVKKSTSDCATVEEAWNSRRPPDIKREQKCFLHNDENRTSRLITSNTEMNCISKTCVSEIFEQNKFGKHSQSDRGDCNKATLKFLNSNDPAEVASVDVMNSDSKTMSAQSSRLQETANSKSFSSKEICRTNSTKVGKEVNIKIKGKQTNRTTKDESSITLIEEQYEKEKGGLSAELSKSTYRDLDSTVNILRFICKHCSFCTTSHTVLVLHYYTKHQEVEVPSQFPKSKTPSSESSLKKQITRSPDTYVCQCRYCKISFKCTKQFFWHLREHTGEYLYICLLCGHPANYNSDMIDHYTSKHSKESEMCVSKCSFKFKNKNVVMGFECSTCKAVKMVKSNMEEHFKTYHKGKKTIGKPVNMDMIGDFSGSVTNVSVLDSFCNEALPSSPEPMPPAQTTIESSDELPDLSCINDKVSPKKKQVQVETEDKRNDNKIFSSADVCKEKFAKPGNKVSLETGLVRPVEGKFPCAICENYVAEGESNFQNHLLWKHGSDRSFSCYWCKRPFYAVNSITLHIKSAHVSQSDNALHLSQDQMIDFEPLTPATPASVVLHSVRQTVTNTEEQSDSSIKDHNMTKYTDDKQTFSDSSSRCNNLNNLNSSNTKNDVKSKHEKSSGEDSGLAVVDNSETDKSMSSMLTEKFAQNIESENSVSLHTDQDNTHLMDPTVSSTHPKTVEDHIQQEGQRGSNKHCKEDIDTSNCSINAAKSARSIERFPLALNLTTGGKEVNESSVDGKFYRCAFSKCMFKTENAEEFPFHMITVHCIKISKHVPFLKCCGEHFFKMSSFRSHLEISHVGSKFLCDRCPGNVPPRALSNYIMHLRIRHEINNFQCFYCVRGFSQVAEIAEHNKLEHHGMPNVMYDRQQLASKKASQSNAPDTKTLEPTILDLISLESVDNNFTNHGLLLYKTETLFNREQSVKLFKDQDSNSSKHPEEDLTSDVPNSLSITDDSTYQPLSVPACETSPLSLETYHTEELPQLPEQDLEMNKLLANKSYREDETSALKIKVVDVFSYSTNEKPTAENHTFEKTSLSSDLHQLTEPLATENNTTSLCSPSPPILQIGAEDISGDDKDMHQLKEKCQNNESESSRFFFEQSCSSNRGNNKENDFEVELIKLEKRFGVKFIATDSKGKMVRTGDKVCEEMQVGVLNSFSETEDQNKDSHNTKEHASQSDTQAMAVSGVAEMDDFYICPFISCTFSTNVASKFKNHLVGCHPGENWYPCKICKKCFKEPDSAVRHTVSHKQDRYKCTACSYSAKHAVSLAKHVNEEHPETGNITPGMVLNNPIYRMYQSDHPGKKSDSLVYIEVNFDEKATLTKRHVPDDCKIRNTSVPLLQISTDVRNADLISTGGDYEKFGIPNQTIFDNFITCSICADFSTKVRLNLIRHLKHSHPEGSPGESLVMELPPPKKIAEVQERREKSLTVARGKTNNQKKQQKKGKLVVKVTKPKTPKDSFSTRFTDPSTPNDLLKKYDLPYTYVPCMQYHCIVDSCKYVTDDSLVFQMHIVMLHSTVNQFACK